MHPSQNLGTDMGEVYAKLVWPEGAKREVEVSRRAELQELKRERGLLQQSCREE